MRQENQGAAMTTPIEAMMNQVEWRKVDDKTNSKLPWVTHEGLLKIADIKLRCYRLNDGRSIINSDDMHELFGDLLS